MSESAQDLYSLGLHQVAELSAHTVAIRVPGGWVYRVVSDFGTAAVFVPWDNEFQSEYQPNGEKNERT